MADKVFEFNGFDVIAQELEVVPKESILKYSTIQMETHTIITNMK